jgi:hypothetical protein
MRLTRPRAALISLALVVAPALAEEPPAPSPSARPISASVERLLKRLEEEEKPPCHRALSDKVPCFPVEVDTRAPEYSVAKSLQEFVPDGSPSPSRPPTRAELAPKRPGYVGPTTATFFSVDPTCLAKSALKKLKGKNDAYYLYRLRDRTGERPVLTDRPLDAAAYAAHPDLRYELIGKFDGECEAIAAYRQAERAGPPVP